MYSKYKCNVVDRPKREILKTTNASKQVTVTSPQSIELVAAPVPSESLKVLHVYRTYYPDTQGGLEEVIRQICSNTMDDNIESKVFTLTESSGQNVIKRPEAIVYRSKLTVELASCGMSWQALSQFKQLLEWADIVHYHFPWPFADLLHFAASVKKPSVITYHSDIVRQKMLGRIYQPLMHRFLNSADSIVCTSPNYFATSEVLARYSSKVDVIPIGLNEGSYETPVASDVAEVEQAYGRDFFLFVGVLRYYKGLHILLDAIKDSPFNVVIAGSGPTEKELVEQAERQGLDNIHFAGHVSNIEKAALFQLCRGVVFPSYLRSEAFGVTLLEGAMFAKPLISTEVGSGTSHVNVHGETGLVIPPGSAKALRRAMRELWQQPDKARLMGKRARERYESLFTGELMGKRYAHLYRRTVSQQDT